jgi:hypothetical protein
MHREVLGDWRSRLARDFDHGELNIPGRTNRINSQLDAYKREQAASNRAAAKMASAQRAADKTRAKELMALHGEAFIARHANTFGAPAIRDTLTDMVKWQPARAVAMLEKHVAEVSA